MGRFSTKKTIKIKNSKMIRMVYFVQKTEDLNFSLLGGQQEDYMYCSTFHIYSSAFIHSLRFLKSLKQHCGNVVEKGNVEEYMNCSTFYDILPYSYSLQYSIKV